MSHRKVYSQGSIPFSWEDSPGVSKATSPPSPPTPTTFRPRNIVEEYTGASAGEVTKIPPPPCPKPKARDPQRSLSAKGFRHWWQEDPFLAAYKECTKATPRNGKHSPSVDQDKKLIGLVGSKSKVKKDKLFVFSCKSSSDVIDDTFVRSSSLAPLPRDHRARDR